jgi:hypothetical protein
MYMAYINVNTTDPIDKLQARFFPRWRAKKAKINPNSGKISISIFNTIYFFFFT